MRWERFLYEVCVIGDYDVFDILFWFEFGCVLEERCVKLDVWVWEGL